jgi:hypothetical protein
LASDFARAGKLSSFQKIDHWILLPAVEKPSFPFGPQIVAIAGIGPFVPLAGIAVFDGVVVDIVEPCPEPKDLRNLLFNTKKGDALLAKFEELTDLGFMVLNLEHAIYIIESQKIADSPGILETVTQ